MEMNTVLDVATVLATIPRLGSDTDEPEGSRYIQVSDTLVMQMVRLLLIAELERFENR